MNHSISYCIWRSGAVRWSPKISLPWARASSTACSPRQLLEEEETPSYDAKHYLPAKLGDVVRDRYKLATKLGHGTSSTVWLASDTHRWRWQSPRYVAIKVIINHPKARQGALLEIEMSEKVINTSRQHPGRQHIRTIVDHFEVQGPEGAHLCLVYEPMREPLWLLQRRLSEGTMSSDLLKVMGKGLLQGIDYLHAECNIIHTDLKNDNILSPFESRDVIQDAVDAEAENPIYSKAAEDGRVIYLSRNNFGPLRSMPGTPKISDFGLAVWGNVSNPHKHLIQPLTYRAPEVLFGLGWSYGVDIWAFGAMMWEMLENKPLFGRVTEHTEEVSIRAHVARMISLLGPPPVEMLHQAELPNDLFESDGSFKYPELVDQKLDLADTIRSFEGQDKDLFLAFARRMLQWRPENRSTARELLHDPWLGYFPE